MNVYSQGLFWDAFKFIFYFPIFLNPKHKRERSCVSYAQTIKDFIFLLYYLLFLLKYQKYFHLYSL